jgi:hypothetical protein
VIVVALSECTPKFPESLLHNGDVIV